MLAAPRTKTIREAEKVFLVNLIEDGDHGLLDDLVLQCRDPQRTFPSIFFLYVHSSRRQRPVRSTMNPAVQVCNPTLQPGLILQATSCRPLRVRLFASRSESFP